MKLVGKSIIGSRYFSHSNKSGSNDLMQSLVLQYSIYYSDSFFFFFNFLIEFESRGQNHKIKRSKKAEKI